MITTKQIQLDQKTYFQLLLNNKLVRRWYMSALPIVIAGVLYFTLPEWRAAATFLFVYGVVNPIWISIYIYIHTKSDRAQSAYLPRHYRFYDNGKIEVEHESAEQDEFSWSDISEIKEHKNAWLLYFSPGQFIYLPFSALEDTDKQKLSKWIKDAKK